MKGLIKNNEEIPNLMGFISQTDKTGILTMVSKGDQIEVGFVKGKVNAAVYKRGGAQELIKEYLVNSGKITNDDFNKITSLHRETKKPYEDILIHEKYINEKQWKDIIHFKIQEIIDELFIWETGSYEFIEDVIMYENSKLKISINTQGLIMEGMRRIDEWPNIIDALPSQDMCFAKKADMVIPENIGSEEKRLLDIINSSRDLKELVRISGLGKYITYQAIYNLLKLSLIVKSKKTRKRETRTRKKPIQVSRFVIVSWIFILFITLLAGIAGRFSFDYTYAFVTESEKGNNAEIAYNKDNVEALLDVYFMKKGYYPKTLDEIADMGWGEKKLMEDYIYIRRGNDYTLTIK